MAAIIDDNGNISYLGYKFNYTYHAQCLMDYASKKYPNISGFDKIDYIDEPNMPVYYLSLLNNVIFTNVSVDDEKRGMLYLPKNMSLKQIDRLLKFVDTVLEFNIVLVYDLSLSEGMVIGKEVSEVQKDDIANFITKSNLKTERRI